MQINTKISFAKRIDYTELFYHASEIAGVDLSFDMPKVEMLNHNVSVKFQSGDITEKCGAFKNILEWCHVHCYANIVDVDITGELFLWLDVSLSYEHKDGECNSLLLFNAWYTESHGWMFANAGE